MQVYLFVFSCWSDTDKEGNSPTYLGQSYNSAPWEQRFIRVSGTVGELSEGHHLGHDGHAYRIITCFFLKIFSTKFLKANVSTLSCWNIVFTFIPHHPVTVWVSCLHLCDFKTACQVKNNSTSPSQETHQLKNNLTKRCPWSQNGILGIGV